MKRAAVLLLVFLMACLGGHPGQGGEPSGARSRLANSAPSHRTIDETKDVWFADRSHGWALIWQTATALASSRLLGVYEMNDGGRTWRLVGRGGDCTDPDPFTFGTQDDGSRSAPICS